MRAGSRSAGGGHGIDDRPRRGRHLGLTCWPPVARQEIAECPAGVAGERVSRSCRYAHEPPTSRELPLPVFGGHETLGELPYSV